jgi:hypothetical protein|tara:strand:+ start:2384 stop:2599 length:216 start_codon:yes stop_codon:yes gene_type:complete
MAVQTTKTITISAEEILRDYICQAQGFTISEYNAWAKYNKPKILWDIKETGDHDWGTYKAELEMLTITIEE